MKETKPQTQSDDLVKNYKQQLFAHKVTTGFLEAGNRGRNKIRDVDIPSDDANIESRTVIVRGFPISFGIEGLHQYLSSCGRVLKVNSKYTDKKEREFTVEFEHESEAQTATGLDGEEVFGHVVRVLHLRGGYCILPVKSTVGQSSSRAIEGKVAATSQGEKGSVAVPFLNLLQKKRETQPEGESSGSGSDTDNNQKGRDVRRTYARPWAEPPVAPQQSARSKFSRPIAPVDEKRKLQQIDNSALLNAVAVGESDKVRRALQTADVHYADQFGTALHYAAHRGHADIVSLLLEKGAQVDAVDSYGWTPLHRACQQGHLKVVNLLLEHMHAENIDIPPGLLTVEQVAKTPRVVETVKKFRESLTDASGDTTLKGDFV